MLKNIFILSFIMLMSCNEEPSSKSVKIQATIADKAMSTSKNRVIRGAGKVGATGFLSGIYEQSKQHEIDQLIWIVDQKFDYEKNLKKYLKHEVKISMVKVRDTSKNGYLEPDKHLIFSFKVFGIKNKPIYVPLSSKEYNMFLIQGSIIMNCPAYALGAPKLYPINKNISLVCHTEENKYAVIYNNKYYSWFNSFAKSDIGLK